MLIVHGVYRLRPKRVGYRSDFCLSCEKPQVAFEVMTFNLLHVFWIPVAPLGWRRRWTCSQCGNDPHAARRTRKVFKILGIIALLFISAMFWAMPYIGPTKPEDWVMIWTCRVMFTGFLVAMVVSLRRHQGDINLKAELAKVQPATGFTCLFCGGPLGAGSVCTCLACGCRQYSNFPRETDAAPYRF